MCTDCFNGIIGIHSTTGFRWKAFVRWVLLLLFKNISIYLTAMCKWILFCAFTESRRDIVRCLGLIQEIEWCWWCSERYLLGQRMMFPLHCYAILSSVANNERAHESKLYLWKNFTTQKSRRSFIFHVSRWLSFIVRGFSAKIDNFMIQLGNFKSSRSHFLQSPSHGLGYFRFIFYFILYSMFFNRILFSIFFLFSLFALFFSFHPSRQA